jgi:hypothetical protein
MLQGEQIRMDRRAENRSAPGVSPEKPMSASRLAARRWLVGIVALLPVLTGCAAPPASSMGHRLQSMSGASKMEAFHKADKKCNEYGRAAESVAYDGSAGILTFRCIEP